MRRRHEEGQHQMALIEWANLNPEIGPYLFHPANGGYRKKSEAFFLKRQGVKAGVSDLFYAYPIAPYAGLWIELKALEGKVTAPQREWIERMKKVGYWADVAWGWEHARDIILDYRRNLNCSTRNICK